MSRKATAPEITGWKHGPLGPWQTVDLRGALASAYVGRSTDEVAKRRQWRAADLYPPAGISGLPRLYVQDCRHGALSCRAIYANGCGYRQLLSDRSAGMAAGAIARSSGRTKR